MTPSSPSPEVERFLEYLRSRGIDPDEQPEASQDLAAIPVSEWTEGMLVTPTPAILRYLATDDILTQETIDIMETVIERAANVTAPWFVTSRREGSVHQCNLRVVNFHLLRDPGPGAAPNP